MFTSFKPRKFATKRENNYKDATIMFGHKFNELCSECGYPYGLHYGYNCPTDEQYKEVAAYNLAKVIPYHAPEKLTQRQKDIRIFRKFLYDNDALEAWYKNRKNYKWRKKGSVFAPLSKERFIIGAFSWSETPEGVNYWIKLYEKWKRML